METVAWVTGWYELDRPLAVGGFGEFAFWRTVPDYLQGPERLALYNTLWHPANVVVACGTIAAIWHPELGAIHKVNARGLDYTITLADGTELLVNAEEQPGKLFERVTNRWQESSRAVSAWRFTVEFESLTEPKPA